MPAIVVPFRSGDGKRRLAPLPAPARDALARAMLRDVVAACGAVGETTVASGEPLPALGVEVVQDPAGGQGAAVAAALARIARGPVLVVNADLPCVTPRDLLALLGALPERGLALVEATDGTTNALALAEPRLFAPLYGPRSANRFRAHAAGHRFEAATLAIPNLEDDVDTLADLERVRPRVGRHTEEALEAELEPAL